MLQSSVARIQQGCSPIGCCGVDNPGQGWGDGAGAWSRKGHGPVRAKMRFSNQGLSPAPPAVEAQCLNPWTTREFLALIFWVYKSV